MANLKTPRFKLKLAVWFLTGLGLLLVGSGLWAQTKTVEYEKRAQEMVAGLLRLNGLTGWVADVPSSWPESRVWPEAVKVDRAGQSVAWNRQVSPVGLKGLTLVNLGLKRVANLSGLIYLENLELYGNQLQGLNLNNSPALTHLAAAKNKLSKLDLSGCPQLDHLALSANELEKLDLTSLPGLRQLSISTNKLSSLDLSHNQQLSHLEAMSNQLAHLSVSQNPALTNLLVSYNQLTELDLSANPNLIELGARDNQLTNLDLRRNPRLTKLIISRNQLTSLDLAANPEIKILTIDYNQLTRLDLSQSNQLERLEAQQNPLTEIILPEAGLTNLISLNLDGGRLPLSQLAPLVGQTKKRARFGIQEPVIFEQLTLALGQELDLSAEAEIGGASTDFVILTDKKRRVKAKNYEETGGKIKFLLPGRYQVLMTNDRVLSSEVNDLTGRGRTFKVKAQTGLIEVLPPNPSAQVGLEP